MREVNWIFGCSKGKLTCAVLREKAMTWVKRWYAQDGEGGALRIWKAWAERSALRYVRVKKFVG